MSLLDESSSTAAGHRYERVRVLLLGWEQDARYSQRVRDQLRNMGRLTSELNIVFKDIYNYEVEEWSIPMQESQSELNDKLSQFRKSYNKPMHLLILYYGGHGGVDAGGDLLWKCHSGRDSPELNWSSLQNLLLANDTKADVLFIIDCCYGGGAVVPPRTKVQGNLVHILAAAGFDSGTPLDGPDIFTANLIDVLKSERTYLCGAKVYSIYTTVYNRLQRWKMLCGGVGDSAVHHILRDCPPAERTISLGRLEAPHFEEAHIYEGLMMQSESLSAEPSTELGHCRTASDELEHTANHQDQAVAAQHHKNTLYPCTGNSEAKRMEPEYQSRKVVWNVRRISKSSSNAQLTSPPLYAEGVGDWCDGSPSLDCSAKSLTPSTSIEADNVAYLESLHYPRMITAGSLIEDPKELERFPWVFDHEEFYAWLVEGHGIFWVSGNAGCGKSTLMRTLFRSKATRNALSCWADPNGFDVLAFVFGDSDTDLQRSASGMIRTLMFQLLENHRPFTLDTPERPGYPGKNIDVKHWSEGVLEANFHRLLEQYQLDGHHTLDTLLRHQSLRFKPAVQHISITIHRRSQLVLEKHTHSDIATLVRLEFASRNVTRNLQDTESACDLVNKIGTRSNGHFLWAIFVAETIQRRLTDGEPLETISAQLNDFPVTLRGIYQSVFDGLDFEHQCMASKIVQILRASQFEIMENPSRSALRGSLTTVGLYFALVEDKYEDITGEVQLLDRSACVDLDRQARRKLSMFTRGLLDYVPTIPGEQLGVGYGTPIGQRIYYIHETVREFFEDPVTDAMLRRMTAGLEFDPNLSLLKSSVLHLKSIRFVTPSGRIQDAGHELRCWSLVEQAMFCAARVENHFSLVVRWLDELDRIMTIQFEKCYGSGVSGHWSRFLPLGRPIPEDWHNTFLSLAITYSVFSYVEVKVSDNPALVTDDRGRPLLDYALHAFCAFPDTRGKVEPKIVQVLVEHGAWPDQEFDDESLWIRFLKACETHSSETKVLAKTKGILEARQLILDYEADGRMSLPLKWRPRSPQHTVH